jgi:beta-glucosidase
MPKAKFSFPKDFLWGTATAAHQVEGNNTNNNWSQWENTPGKIIHGDKAGLACDWWGGRWKEDLGNASRDGQNTHRFSVEWSRIQPSPDRWDEGALEYYRQMLKGMHRLRLEPMLTLHHFSDPLWVSERGGWENEGIIELFQQFTRKVVMALKDQVKMWVTINEPSVYFASAFVLGVFPPGLQGDLNCAYLAARNMLRAHAAAYHIIHELQPEAMVGLAHHYRPMHPARPLFLPDRWIANFLNAAYNEAFPMTLLTGRMKYITKREAIPEARGTQDFLGLNYYSMDVVTFDLFNPRGVFHQRSFPKDAELSENKFNANTPLGMMEALQWARKFRLPIYITENGIEDSQDVLRPKFMLEHIHQVWRAVNFNWDVRGYYHWSQIDNFEWERGWTQRFGLWGLESQTQKRIRRRSTDLYAAICKENGISSEMVAKFVPQLTEKLFPG